MNSIGSDLKGLNFGFSPFKGNSTSGAPSSSTSEQSAPMGQAEETSFLKSGRTVSKRQNLSSGLKPEQSFNEYLEDSSHENDVSPVANAGLLVGFLNIMQEKFNISPQQILESFSNLDENNLKSPPELSVRQFVEGLPLKESDRFEVSSLYRNLLQQTGDQELNDQFGSLMQQLPENQPAKLYSSNLKPSARFEFSDRQNLDREKALQELDRMTERFFLRSQGVPLEESNQFKSDLGPTTLKNMDQPISKSTENLPTDFLTSSSAEAPQQEVDGSNVLQQKNQWIQNKDKLSQNSTKQKEPSVVPMAVTTGEGSRVSAGVGAGAAMSTEARFEAESDVAQKAATQIESTDQGRAKSVTDKYTDGMSISNNISNRDNIVKFDKNANSSMNSDSDPQSSESYDFQTFKFQRTAPSETTRAKGGSALQNSAPASGAVQAAVSAAVQSAQDLDWQSAAKAAPVATSAAFTMSEQDQSNNIQEILRQAQIMTRQGGGEVKVQLHPEGLGSVLLKVAVQNGQVSVQMLADSESARQTLESGMNELRFELAAQKLHLDSLHVDSRNKNDMHEVSRQVRSEQAGEHALKGLSQSQDPNLSTDLNNNGQNNPRSDANSSNLNSDLDSGGGNSRQWAQSDFLNQWREDRQAFRQSWFDNGGGRRGYDNADPTASRREKIEPTSNQKSASASASASGRRAGRRINVVA